MLELYFNDGNFLPESREEEQSAETVLNIMLAGKTTDTEMCIWPCFYHAPMCKGVLINLDDGTTLLPALLQVLRHGPRRPLSRYPP